LTTPAGPEQSAPLVLAPEQLARVVKARRGGGARACTHVTVSLWTHTRFFLVAGEAKRAGRARPAGHTAGARAGGQRARAKGTCTVSLRTHLLLPCLTAAFQIAGFDALGGGSFITASSRDGDFGAHSTASAGGHYLCCSFSDSSSHGCNRCWRCCFKFCTGGVVCRVRGCRVSCA
jgi:hypothetical protein